MKLVGYKCYRTKCYFIWNTWRQQIVLKRKKGHFENANDGRCDMTGRNKKQACSNTNKLFRRPYVRAKRFAIRVGKTTWIAEISNHRGGTLLTSHVPPGDYPFWRAIHVPHAEARTLHRKRQHAQTTGPTGMPERPEDARQESDGKNARRLTVVTTCTHNERVRHILPHT